MAFIAQNLEEDNDFIDKEVDNYFLLDAHVQNSKFVTPTETLQMMYMDAHCYEESLPTKEEFSAAQKRLCITKMGRVQPSIVAT